MLSRYDQGEGAQSGLTYTDEHFERMKTDDALRRQYFWQCGQAALLRSIRARRTSLKEAQHEARFGRLVLDNLDALVHGTRTEG